jgi:hypothetical protein
MDRDVTVSRRINYLPVARMKKAFLPEPVLCEFHPITARGFKRGALDLAVLQFF